MCSLRWKEEYKILPFSDIFQIHPLFVTFGLSTYWILSFLCSLDTIPLAAKYTQVNIFSQSLNFYILDNVSKK